MISMGPIREVRVDGGGVESPVPKFSGLGTGDGE